ncbi:hypothetical protein DJ019_04925 [Phenylobacterium kunshanense]|uniref:SH3b domain-containing protein n=2 Tax=Phenylobacterium kunshanense TaxID=1445034 RepID=A0A328BKT7_9CAUL|nr:hypothetical protein DJ019_04925 [Phenylobacterium kunshanense]
MMGDDMDRLRNDRRLRVAVSVIALLGVTAQPVLAQKKDADACAAERAPLVKLDKEYDDLKRSKMSKAIGEGLKSGAMVLAKGVASGNIGLPGGRGGGFGGMGGMGSLMGAVGGLAMQSAAQQQTGGAAPAPSGLMFGPDMLAGASGLYVPGVTSYGGFGGGDNGKAYAALAVLVAIVATADAYAKLKEEEAGGDLRKASHNIDQDAGRQLEVARQISDSGNALVECRSRQLNDINTRLASASNDKDRKAIRRERTELISDLKKDIDVTGSVVEQHTGMAKTFTQGRAMTDGASEADVLGGQAPAYAAAPEVTRLSMPKGAASSGGAPQQASAPAAAPAALVTTRVAVLRSGPVASAAPVRNLPVGTALQAKTANAEGGWWEVDVEGETGYVRAAEVGPPGSAPAAPVQTAAAGKGRGKGPPPKAAAAAPAPPAVAGPTNIRAYNRQVIVARDEGKGRLGALMTDIQAAQRRDNVFYAMLSNWRWS